MCQQQKKQKIKATGKGCPMTERSSSKPPVGALKEPPSQRRASGFSRDSVPVFVHQHSDGSQLMDASPTIRILLLGDSDCGKSAFLSKLSHGANFMREKTTAFPSLRDLDQPFVYDVRMYNRPYRFEFYDTSCPENYTLLRPDFVILCYSIGNRESLVNLQHVWFKKMVQCYMREREDIPVMMLGLKRDLRKEEEGIILPQEGVKVAQGLRCDRYAECSALTGELMNEVMEDIARTAAKTTTEAGGLSQGGCIVM